MNIKPETLNGVWHVKDTNICFSKYFDQNAGQEAEIQGKTPIWWVDNPVPENIYIYMYI